MNRCGECEFARIVPGLDLTRRSCQGGPPQMVMMGFNNGQPILQKFWPDVGIADQACGTFRKAVVTVPCSVCGDPYKANDICGRNGMTMEGCLRQRSGGCDAALPAARA